MSSAGIYGGNFDPVHLGHLITARKVLEIRSLDKIIFIPAYISPFKKEISSAPAFHRITMLREAVKGIPAFEVSDYEIVKEGISYTIDTLKHFKQKYDQLDLLIGYDNLVEFTEWKEPEEIINLVNLIVLKRIGSDLPQKKNKFFNAAVFPDTPLIEISSSDIRRRIRENRVIDFLVPDGVKEYIIKNNLYKE